MKQTDWYSYYKWLLSEGKKMDTAIGQIQCELLEQEQIKNKEIKNNE